MSPFTVLRRIWLPRAFRIVLPTLGGEVILQLKSTPVAALVTVPELYGAARPDLPHHLRLLPANADGGGDLYRAHLHHHPRSSTWSSARFRRNDDQ